MKKVDYIQKKEKWREQFSFYTEISPRFSETDLFGHVNNTAIFIYFEQARIEFLKSGGLYTELSEQPKVVPVVADLQCDYHRQIFFDDLLKLYVKVAQFGTTSFDLHYLGVNQHGKVCVTGRGKLVQVNPATGKPVALDEQTKQKLNTMKLEQKT